MREKYLLQSTKKDSANPRKTTNIFVFLFIRVKTPSKLLPQSLQNFAFSFIFNPQLGQNLLKLSDLTLLSITDHTPLKSFK